MKKYTQKTALQFFKEKKESYLQLQLKDNFSIILYIKRKGNKFSYSYEIIKKGKANPLNFEESSNYNDFIEEIHSYLKKKKLLPKSSTWVSIEVNKNSLDLEDFSLEVIEVSKGDGSLSKLSLKDLEDNIYEVKIKRNNKMIIIWEKKQEERIYSRNDLIKIMVDYIKKLVNKRKNNSNFNINHLINVINNKGQNQKLNIVEEEGSIWGKEENWFIDKNLINTVFFLCSLEDLAIDEQKLKIWLNKIMIKQNLFLVRFERF